MPGTPPPPGTPVWTLNAANLSGGNLGVKLAGCHIIQYANNYVLTTANWDVLATSSGPPRPTTGFTFPTFTLKDITGWTITMPAPPTDTTQNWSAGSWSFPNQPMPEDVPITGQSGEFTAQAGSGPVAHEEEASSATA